MRVLLNNQLIGLLSFKLVSNVIQTGYCLEQSKKYLYLLLGSVKRTTSQFLY